MSNILIIKHGSLGDLIQANGAMKDIKQSFPNDKVFLLTTPPYANFMSYCPYINGVVIDKRLPRWNILYLLKLKKTIERFSFTKVFDLQNSSRTKFYRKIFFKNANWSSSETSLEKDQKKKDFDQEPVLKRMKIQLEKSGISTNYTENPDLTWAIKNVQSLMNQYIEGNYIAIFPFCSSKHKDKIWPYFNQLIKENGIVAPKGTAGSTIFFHGCTIHGSAPNMSPWGRAMVFSSLNRVENFIRKPTRPDFLALQDFTPLTALDDDCLTTL